MNAPNISESTATLIETHIRDNIEAALTDVNTERGDNIVNLPPIKKFYIAEKKILIELPALFTIVKDSDFRLREKNPNHINAAIAVDVSLVVEERDSDRLTIKSWRYQDALFSVLDQAQLVDSNSDVKLVVKVMRASYSPTYEPDQGEASATGVFRKEVMLELEVDHFERLN